jgi:hypothetical protein
VPPKTRGGGGLAHTGIEPGNFRIPDLEKGAGPWLGDPRSAVTGRPWELGGGAGGGVVGGRAGAASGFGLPDSGFRLPEIQEGNYRPLWLSLSPAGGVQRDIC